MEFQEKQYFRQPWLWVIIGLSFIYLVSSLDENHRLSLASLGYSALILSPLVLLFAIMNLRTIVNQEGIKATYFPFHFQPRLIKWEEIQKIEILQYHPLLDYGGWGIRGLGEDKAYNVRGNKGAKIYYKNGRTLLIGTQKPSEMYHFIKNICPDLELYYHIKE